jgi:SAM-dependent methyltransferase
MTIERILRRALGRQRPVSAMARAYRSALTATINLKEGRPVSAGMEDPHFKARFVDVPAILADWFRPHSRIQDADVLDFGCGEGIAALGLALGFHPRRVVGVDIMPDPARCLEVAKKNLPIESLPECLQLHQVEPGHLHDSEDRFDLAYSWSVFEHVDQTLLDPSLALIRAALRPGGLFLAQIAPLYYSAEGSHLNHVLTEPWVHLRTQQNRLEDMLRRAVSDATEADALWSTYCTLNKITHQDLVSRISNNGFEILRTFTTTQDIEPPAELLDVFQAEALTTNQVVVLARASGTVA